VHKSLEVKNILKRPNLYMCKYIFIFIYIHSFIYVYKYIYVYVIYIGLTPVNAYFVHVYLLHRKCSSGSTDARTAGRPHGPSL